MLAAAPVRLQARGRAFAHIARFHPELTGRENVYLNGSILGLSRKQTDRYFDSIVDFAGIGDFVSYPAGVPHRLRNVGTEPARVLSALLVPTGQPADEPNP